MGQARRRREEIIGLKLAGPKVPAQLKNFKPDAGLNSEEGLNHYWFQVAEMIESMIINPKTESYLFEGRRWITINVPVDIMDQQGVEHRAPKTLKGYFATFRFSLDQLEHLADQINKGAQSVRIDGQPKEVETSPIGEKFRVIEVSDSWSAGNNAGYMMYHIYSGQKSMSTTSRELSENLKRICREAQTA